MVATMKKSPVSLSWALLAAISIGAMVSCSSSISGQRPVAADGRAIHRPDQLDDFVLKEPVDFQGLGARAALEKLDREYRETCRRAGEVPLELAYEVSAGSDQPLNFTAFSGYFEDGIREIAATSELEWERRGNTYRFHAPPETRENRRLGRETHAVPPDFLSRISGEPVNRRSGARGAFEKRGVSLDSSTRVTLVGSQLSVESRSRSDEKAISGVVKSVTSRPPLQIRVDARTFEVPPGQPWSGFGREIVDDHAVAALRRIPSVKEQVISSEELFSSPLRSHESRLMKLGGGTLRVEPAFLGFGIQVKADLSQKPREGRPVRISMEGQTRNGSTRISTATRPDGSRVVLAVTPTIIDATGRPVRR
jgi:hypothetical protein